MLTITTNIMIRSRPDDDQRQVGLNKVDLGVRLENFHSGQESWSYPLRYGLQAVISMTDFKCTQFLQWSLPKLRMRWRGFRKVRGQVEITRIFRFWLLNTVICASR